MTLVALRGLLGRKLRTILTALAIVLGVALVSGSFVLTDTISKAFDTIFASSYDKTDAVVSGRKIVDFSSGGNATVSPQLLGRIRSLPSVQAAAGQVIDLNGNSTQAKLVVDGKPVQTNGNPTFGIGVDPRNPQFNPLQLRSGHWARGLHQVVVDAAVAESEHLQTGDPVGVAADGPTRPFRVVGIATYGGVESLGGASIAVFDLPTARALLHKPGYDAISVSAKPGVSTAALMGELRSVAPATAKVQSGDDYAKEQAEGINEFISFIRWFLLAFGGIALFVGAFVIFNTLSITVAQRTREFATLRTLGAARRQIMRSVITESAVQGAAASVIGLFLGLGLAKGLSSLMDALGLSLPQAGTVFALRTVIVSLALGIVITLVAGVAPAIRATRVPPIAAVREGAVLSAPKRWTPYAGTGLAAFASALLAYGLFAGGVGTAGRIASIALGTLLLFVGVAVVSPRLVPALVRIVGQPSARFGIAGRLARRNATRNAGRTAAMAAALMIGLALVTFVAVFAEGLRSSDESAVRSQLNTSYVVTSESAWQPLPASAGNAVASASGVHASSVVTDRGRFAGENIDVSGVEPRTIVGPYRFEWKQGSDATVRSLGRDEAVVAESFADDHGLGVGSSFRLVTTSGAPMPVHVKAIYEPAKFDPLLGEVIVSRSTFASAFPRSPLAFTLVQGGDAATIERSLRQFPDATVRTTDGFVKSRTADLSTILNLLYVLLALSGSISLFGMVNTLALGVSERTREVGMLRAVGMTRRQTRRMVRHEGIITALIGAALGIPLGLGFAAIVTQALSKYGLGFTVPVGTLAVFVVVAIVSGLAAAIIPARRASRLNVLRALQYE
jgi:putative ABC transport system permease protein